MGYPAGCSRLGHALEVHAVVAEHHGRNRQDRAPPGQPLDDVVLRDRHQRHVHRDRRGQHFADHVQRADQPVGVVGHVAEVRAQLLGHDIFVQAHQLAGDVLHRQRGVAQAQQLALERVQPLDGGTIERIAEELALDRVERRLHGFEHRLVIVDHEIHHRVQRERRPLGQQVRHVLAALAHRRVRRRRPVPHRDQEVAPDEQVRFAEDHLALLHLRRVQHDEERVAVGLQLGALVGLAGVFDGEVVQVEFLLHAGEHGVVRLVQAQPDEGARRVQHIADGLDRQVALAPAVAIQRAVDHHGHASVSGGVSALRPARR